MCDDACADPESFVRGGPNLITIFFLVDGGIEGQKNTLIAPSLACQKNAFEMAFRWRADDGPKLNAPGLVAL